MAGYDHFIHLRKKVPMPSTTQKPELLAPAGDWECLRAAVANGADAVYFGVGDFNARHRATNFSLEELPKIFEFLHLHGVRGYVTLNTLIFSAELPTLAQYLEQIAAAGADAIIVQDLGLARLARTVCPQLEVHASTQTTQTESRGLAFLQSLGVRRAILARELSLPEIQAIRQTTDLPLEVFVHGALCVAYSGQCLTSEAIGGRSANRGQCAQACRLPYDLVVDGQVRPLDEMAYLLSPQDLAAFDMVPEILSSGVASLKIEGRLKSPHYVAVVTQTYRRAMDAALAGEDWKLDRQGELDLAQSFSRGFSPGFLAGVNHQQLVQGRFPKSRGVLVGTVLRTTNETVILRLDHQHHECPLRPGDGVVFDEGHPEQDEQGGRVYEVHVRDKSTIELAFGRGAINLRAIAEGAQVWKTDDPALRKRLEKTYEHTDACQHVPVTFAVSGSEGGALTVSISDEIGNMAEAMWPGPLQLARKHPADAALLANQLGRLGGTPFLLSAVQNDLVGLLMVPTSVLNDLRRQLVAELTERRTQARAPAAYDRGALPRLRAEIRSRWQPSNSTAPAKLTALVRSIDQLEGVLAWRGSHASAVNVNLVICDFEDPRRYALAVQLARHARCPIALATLRVIKPQEEGLLRQIGRYEPDAVLVRNLAAVEFFREEFPQLVRLGDYSLNVANELTADLLWSAGLARLVPSYDLNWPQLSALLGQSDPARFEVVIHQHMPMFHMEHCVFAHTLSEGKDFRDCGRPCDHHRVDLRDRTGGDLPLLPDVGCRNTVYNGMAQSAAEYLPQLLRQGVRWFRIELLRQTADQVGDLLNCYAEILRGEKAGADAYRRLRALNQLGVTRGTLQVIER
jgi:putative protease